MEERWCINIREQQVEGRRSDLDMGSCQSAAKDLSGSLHQV
jgi:hypothetical protein